MAIIIIIIIIIVVVVVIVIVIVIILVPWTWGLRTDVSQPGAVQAQGCFEGWDKLQTVEQREPPPHQTTERWHRGRRGLSVWCVGFRVDGAEIAFPLVRSG